MTGSIRRPSVVTRRMPEWTYALVTAIFSVTILGLSIFLVPTYLRPSITEIPDSSDPTMRVDLPNGDSKIAVVHLPHQILGKLYPHEFEPNVAEIWTGVGTLLLVATAILAGYLTFHQIRTERHNRRTERLREARIQEQARQASYAETYISVSQQWNTPSFREVRMKIRRFCGEGGPDAVKDNMLALRAEYDPEYWKLLTALDFFENLAILVKYHAISFAMAENALGVVACQYWAMLKPFIDWQRDYEPQDASYYDEFEKFVYAISKKHGYAIPWKNTNEPPSPTSAPTTNILEAASLVVSVAGTFAGTISGG